jgi:hypothetical protein
MYLSQVPLVVGFILLRCVPNIEVSTYLIPLIIYIVLEAIAQLVCLVNLVVAAINITNKKIASPYKFTMLAKIILIPYYILNVFNMVYLLLPVANIFLFVAMPLVIGLKVTLTFFLMLGSGLHNISYLLTRYLKTKDGKYILYIVLHFIFVVDVIAAIVLFAKEKNVNDITQSEGGN